MDTVSEVLGSYHLTRLLASSPLNQQDISDFEKLHKGSASEVFWGNILISSLIWGSLQKHGGGREYLLGPCDQSERTWGLSLFLKETLRTKNEPVSAVGYTVSLDRLRGGWWWWCGQGSWWRTLEGFQDLQGEQQQVAAKELFSEEKGRGDIRASLSKEMLGRWGEMQFYWEITPWQRSSQVCDKLIQWQCHISLQENVKEQAKTHVIG